MEYRDQKWRIPDMIIVILSIICLVLASNIILILLNAEEFLLKSEYKNLIVLALFLLQEAIFLLPLYFLVIKNYRLKLADLGLNKIKLWETIKWVFKGFGIVIIFNALVLILIGPETSLPGFKPQEPHITLFDTSPFGVGAAIVVFIFIAPVVEEILFRGFIFQTLLGKFTPWIASAISGGIFAFIHFEFQSIGIILFLAFVLNWIFMRSKSLWPCIGFHMLNNALVFLVEILLYK
ncbi:CPBP family intramembrane metalloprotease [Candidatus Peregrinibacteria bacterium]|nr:CPBP family intramembrane metalloprotease [Candidatus Peregrinibacteria bacterium]